MIGFFFFFFLYVDMENECPGWLWPVGFFKVINFPGASCAEASPRAEAAAATLLRVALGWCLEKLRAPGDY